MTEGKTPARSKSTVFAALVVGVVALFAGGAGSAWAGTVTVDLVAANASRLAEELRRELGASGFVVVFIPSTGRDWQADVRRLPGNQSRRGVVVGPGDQKMTVFTRVGATGTIQSHFEQPVDSPRDRLARRRACLGVVEYLRLLSETDRTGGVGQHRSGSVALSGEPPSPSPSSSPSSPAPLAVGTSGSTKKAPTPSDPLGVTGGSAAPAAGGGVGGADNDVADTAGRPPQPPEARDPEAPASHTLTSAEAVDRRREKPWGVGVASTFGLAAARGGPTGHLQFLWVLPLEWRLALCVRALWPVVGGQFRADGDDVRTWTFGSAASLQYIFPLGPGRLRPFMGAALGTRVALTESTPVGAMQSKETFTPSVNLGAEGGVRYLLSPLVQLFLEVGVGRGWMIPGVRRAAYEEAAARANSLHASFGVLFEI